MEQFYINHWAVLTCAVVNLLLGAIWYSPMLFYKAWMKENSFTEEDIQKVNPAKTYGITLIISFFISYNLAFFLGDDKTDMVWGTTAGFLAGFGFSALIFTVVALFEQRSWKYILINGGYITLYFTLIGFILGTWR
ncbi:MAG: DUF1761 domain-containing protein [Sphingobacteriales bacterium]|nr:MAG: DUF1761 domain-containing protein [Sphingobacteriales bacterium]